MGPNHTIPVSDCGFVRQTVQTCRTGPPGAADRMYFRTTPARQRRPIIAMLATLALLVAATGCTKTSGASTVTNECAQLRSAWAPVTNKGAVRATGTQITIDAANAGFAPTCITDVPQGAVTLVVRNTGQSIHNVQISAQRVDVDIAPGHTARIRVVVGHDPIVFICKYHRYLGMLGFLVPVGS